MPGGQLTAPGELGCRFVPLAQVCVVIAPVVVRLRTDLEVLRTQLQGGIVLGNRFVPRMQAGEGTGAEHMQPRVVRRR